MHNGLMHWIIHVYNILHGFTDKANTLQVQQLFMS